MKFCTRNYSFWIRVQTNYKLWYADGNDKKRSGNEDKVITNSLGKASLETNVEAWFVDVCRLVHIWIDNINTVVKELSEEA